MALKVILSLGLLVLFTIPTVRAKTQGVVGPEDAEKICKAVVEVLQKNATVSTFAAGEAADDIKKLTQIYTAKKLNENKQLERAQLSLKDKKRDDQETLKEIEKNSEELLGKYEIILKILKEKQSKLSPAIEAANRVFKGEKNLLKECIQAKGNYENLPAYKKALVDGQALNALAIIAGMEIKSIASNLGLKPEK